MRTTKTETQPLTYYLHLPYSVTIYPSAEGGHVAEVRDLPGCLSQGETAEEAMANIEEARRLWIETAYEHGDQIPMPSSDERYSGRMLIRMPRSLHRRLAERAKREGVSLNHYLVTLLSEALGAGKTRRPRLRSAGMGVDEQVTGRGSQA